MALVRVYCGLASAELAAQPETVGAWLTVAIVDDAGRLLDVCELSDDAAGYAQLGALLTERSSGPTGVAIAADSDDHLVTMLLTAAGRPLAFADDDSVDDFAERFGDDGAIEEIESPPADRRAVGLARALQAGVLSAVALPAPRDLAALKPVLAAHAAVVVGRQAAAVALREVLRELYPAALRAYPDPAEPVSLAVLDALPEPGMLGIPTTARGRDNTHVLDSVATALTATGVADAGTVADAITALRVAVAETPRRGGVSKSLTTAVALAVRHAVAAVRGCDAAGSALIGALAERANPPSRTGLRVNRLSPQQATAPTPLRSTRPASAEPGQSRVPMPRRTRAGSGTPFSPAAAGMSAAPVAASPLTASPLTASPLTVSPLAHPAVHPAAGSPAQQPAAPTLPRRLAPAASYGASADIGRGSATPPPPPGITPTQARPSSALPLSLPLPPRQAAPSALPLPPRPTSAPPLPSRTPVAADPLSSPASGAGFGITDYPIQMPRPGAPAERAAPGSRANWPLVGPAEHSYSQDPLRTDSYPAPNGYPAADPYVAAEAGRSEGRVPPPWQADDMPPEPPMLRLVEPPPLADPALRNPLTDELTAPDVAIDVRLDPPSLRLVEGQGIGRPVPRPRRGTAERFPEPPVADNDDGDLLIFAAARSAWFTGRGEDDVPGWDNLSDVGWLAAQSAARPTVGSSTGAGLPKRVPQANLVPGSPLSAPDRPLQIVRDPDSIAAHTTGYFRGWRRGREIGGYAVGGRPGRDSAHGWDFSRDHGEDDYQAQEYEYRQAGYRS